MPFATVELRSWRQLRRHSKRGWVYRGHSSRSWSLKTSLERCCDRERVPRRGRFDFEERLWREFKRTYHQYSVHVPERTDRLEWYALMQHYGTPTRFLDFTYSIYVAAYFACEDGSADAAVWAIDARWALHQSIRRFLDRGKKKARELRRPFDERSHELFEDVVITRPHVRSILPTNPFRLNERLQVQKGVFMVPGDVSASFEANLRALAGHDSRDNVRKIVIPAGLRRTALKELFNMNVSRTNLFPGLDGFARSLGVYHPAFRPIRW
jgi:hypothetical protein